jgi:N-acetylglucosaminyldiphosphoundecaprenol N-acetyl-beta-D-mannosaminyltransferase
VTWTSDSVRPRGSVVVPAHQEAAVIAERLGPLTRGLEGRDVDVVVVANGCTDDTAAVARSLPGVRVVELAEASKIAALDAGDRATTAFPRVYLDADVRLSAEGLIALLEVLDTDRPVVGAPKITFDTSGSSWTVRAFYRIFERLPYTRRGLVGLGVYGLSAKGRSRFGTFPDVTADDLFVQQLFAEDERVTVDETFEVVVPRTLGALLAVRTRVARGNEELARRASALGLSASSTTSGTTRAIVGLVRHAPRFLIPALVYAGVTIAARARARRVRPDTRWERDESSRTLKASASGQVVVGGVPIHRVTHAEVVDRVMRALAAGRGGRIVAADVDIHRQLHRPENRALIRDVDLVVVDGMPLVWASRLQGDPLPERVPRASLVRALARAAAAHDRSVFVVGGAPEAAEKAAVRLAEEVPGLRVAGWHIPPHGFEASAQDGAAIVSALREARPDVVLVALGFPQQERLMAQLSPLFPESWWIGCGGSVDMIAGPTTRVAEFVDRVGLGWLWRLVREPRRLVRRYLVDDLPHAVWLLARAAWARRY